MVRETSDQNSPDAKQKIQLIFRHFLMRQKNKLSILYTYIYSLNILFVSQHKNIFIYLVFILNGNTHKIPNKFEIANIVYNF